MLSAATRLKCSDLPSSWFLRQGGRKESITAACGREGRSRRNRVQARTTHSPLQITPVGDMTGLTELDAPVAAKAALHESLSRWVDVPDVLMLDERFQHLNDLGALVWHCTQLCFGEQWMKDPEICVS